MGGTRVKFCVTRLKCLTVKANFIVFVGSFPIKNAEFGINELFSLVTQDFTRFPNSSLSRKSALNQIQHILHTIFVIKSFRTSKSQWIITFITSRNSCSSTSFIPYFYHLSAAPYEMFYCTNTVINHHYGLFISLIVSFSVLNQFNLVLNFYQRDHNHESHGGRFCHTPLWHFRQINET